MNTTGISFKIQANLAKYAHIWLFIVYLNMNLNLGTPTMQVNILQAKNQLSQLIKYAQAGDDVVIANRGTPVVRLVPEKPVHTHQSANPNFLNWLQANPLPKYAQSSAQEIDAGIAEERSAWD